MSTAIGQATELLTQKNAIPRELMESVIESMLAGRATEDEMGAFLIGLQQQGETVDDLVGAASAMRQAMVPLRGSYKIVLDTCGTGGDGSQTFNISTAAAIVIAAAGVAVAKHGNRKITSSTGSADVLSELGINLAAPTAVVQACLDELRLCFCFAPSFHPAMKHVAAVRRRITGPTIFNRLGPLCNPASANRQVLGVGSADLQQKLALALAELGTERSLVVRGEDGVDEVSLDSSTAVLLTEASHGDAGKRPLLETWEPEDFGLSRHPRAALFADSPASSAACIRLALSGQTGAVRDAVVINAAAGLWLAESRPTLKDCVLLAADAIDSGQARDLVAQLAKMTNS